jgi:hypothetical protein
VDGEQEEAVHSHSDTLRVDSCQVSVFEEGDKVSLSGFLKGHDSGGLEAKVSL